MEEWRDVVGYEGLYQVSSLGNVRSVSRKVKCGTNSQRLVNSKILKQHISDNGYKGISLIKNHKRKRFSVHRLVAEAFIENVQLLPQVNHINANPLDNRVVNLEWCTNLYNARYKKIVSGKKVIADKKKISELIQRTSINMNEIYYLAKALGVDVTEIIEEEN